MRRNFYWSAALALAMAGFRWVPGLAGVWFGRVALPALSALHTLTLALPFPLLEPLALAVLCMGVGRHGMKRLLWAVLVAAGMYALLWYPAYWVAPAPVYSVPNARPLEQLCINLIEKTDIATEVPAIDGIKYARYPEWMRALGISGLFSPWTGEAIADGGAAKELLPFTAIHELCHLQGIADEGEANIAAYRECIVRGGAYAASARLWALRYALPMLSDADPGAYDRVVSRYGAPPDVAAVNVHPLAKLLGISTQTGSYGNLIDWLCMHDIV